MKKQVIGLSQTTPGINRWKELRSLIQKHSDGGGIPKSKSQMALSILQSQRAAKKKNKKSTGEQQSGESTSSSSNMADDTKKATNLVDTLLVDNNKTTATSKQQIIHQRLKIVFVHVRKNGNETWKKRKRPKRIREKNVLLLQMHSLHMLVTYYDDPVWVILL